MTRFTDAAEHLRDRLRTQAGQTATITRDGAAIASGITVVEMSPDRAVRNSDDWLIEEDETSFLIGVDALAGDPQQGDRITVGSRVLVVQERTELETVWVWHGNGQTQRVVFAKEWA